MANQYRMVIRYSDETCLHVVDGGVAYFDTITSKRSPALQIVMHVGEQTATVTIPLDDLPAFIKEMQSAVNNPEQPGKYRALHTTPVNQDVDWACNSCGNEWGAPKQSTPLQCSRCKSRETHWKEHPA